VIHFIRPDSGYSQILDSHIEPIRKHVESTVSSEYEKGKTNVSFFVEYAPSEVFMSHGIADKNWRNQHRVDKFNYICVSGPIWYQKYRGIDPSRILMIGYPKLDPIFQGEYKRTPGRKRILFAPTHTAIPNVSCDSLEFCLDRLPDNWVVTCSLHPANRSDKNPTMQALVDADVVIADCGSMVYEAWALGKPVIFPDWLVKDAILRFFPGSLEAFIYQSGIGLHARSFDEMIDMLGSEIDNKAKNLMEQVFPAELRGQSGEVAAKKLLEVST
jgi:CDP-glycerol glycerophosphotransferase (TagB/SpsB family)